VKKARRQVSRRIWIRGRGLFRNSRYRWLPLSHGSVPNCLESSYSTWMAPEFFRSNWRHRRLSELFFLVDPRGYPLSPALNPRLIQVVIWSNSPRCGGLGAGIVSSLSKLHPTWRMPSFPYHVTNREGSGSHGVSDSWGPGCWNIRY
jgi:hypothetical protein